MLGGGQELVEHPRVGGGQVGGYFCRRVKPASARVRTAGRLLVPFRRQQHVDDLAELVDRPVQVTPPAIGLHIGLVDEPAVPRGVSARPGRLREQRGEPHHPPEHGRVVRFDAAIGE